MGHQTSSGAFTFSMLWAAVIEAASRPCAAVASFRTRPRRGIGSSRRASSAAGSAASSLGVYSFRFLRGPRHRRLDAACWRDAPGVLLRPRHDVLDGDAPPVAAGPSQRHARQHATVQKPCDPDSTYGPAGGPAPGIPRRVELVGGLDAAVRVPRSAVRLEAEAECF